MNPAVAENNYEMQLSFLKNFISEANQEKDVFLSLIDANGSIISANRCMNREFIAANNNQGCFFSLVHPRQLDRFKAFIFDDSEASQWIEIEMKNHRFHPMRWQVVPLQEMGDGKELFLCFGVKIEPGNSSINNNGNKPAKKELEKKMQELQDRLLLLSRATSDAIWEWDMQTGHIFRNDVLMEMIGYQPEDVKGLSWWLRRIHPQDRNRVADTIRESTDQGNQSWQEEYRFRCADGEYKPVQDRGFVVYENGLPVRMIGSLQDLSALKALEKQVDDEKMRMQKELSETVIRVQEQERTRIGHELHDNVNQVLSTAKLFVEMLEPSSKEQKQIRQKSIEYIRMAIDEIRKLSRELVIPQLREKNLCDSILLLVQDIQLSSAIRIKLTHDIENDLLSPGKKITIFRIIQEQLKNILIHSQASQVDVLLQCRNEIVELIVHDNGIGFDPGRTGSGIGLSNIRERTKYYNGSVELKTAPGKGCTLIIKIPIEQ